MDLSNFFRATDLLIYAGFILAYIIISLIRQGFKNELSTRLFLIIAIVLFMVNFLEGLTWILNGTTLPHGHTLVFAANTLLIAGNSLPAAFWVMYADYKIFNDENRLKKRMKWYLIPFYLTLGLLFINVTTGIVFTVDEQNVYSRNIGLYLIVLMTYTMITVLYFRTRRFKQQINGKIMESIFLFMLIPILAGIAQMLFYGILIIWPAFILATLIAFIQIEKETILRDPLTGLPAREQLEQRIHYLRGKELGFALIMGDMNDFKSINDRFGHHEGDQALITAANLLQHTIRSHDNVYRFGGDEFIILVESESKPIVEEILKRIQDGFLAFNHKSGKPYRLSASFGYSILKSAENKSLQELLCEADREMYQHKQGYKNIEQPALEH